MSNKLESVRKVIKDYLNEMFIMLIALTLNTFVLALSYAISNVYGLIPSVAGLVFCVGGMFATTVKTILVVYAEVNCNE